MTNLEKAIVWIKSQVDIDPSLTKAKLIDEASQRYDLTPLEGDYLWKNFQLNKEAKKS